MVEKVTSPKAYKGNLRAIIVEDEKTSRDVLKRFLKDHVDGVNIIGEASDISGAIQVIQDSNPDVVFMDIKLSDGLSFEIFDKLEKSDFEVIFTTAHENFAVQAFKVSAIDYLLKPIKIGELQTAVDKVKKRVHSKEDSTERMKIFINQYENKKITNLVIPEKSGFKVFKLDRIIRIESDGNYSKIFIENESARTVTKTLKTLEEFLSQSGFFRVHNSHLINAKHITGYKSNEGGKVELSDGSKVYISRRRKDAFLSWFHQL